MVDIQFAEVMPTVHLITWQDLDFLYLNASYKKTTSDGSGLNINRKQMDKCSNDAMMGQTRTGGVLHSSNRISGEE